MITKILHTADLHLDSAMSSYLPKDKAKERKNELLLSLENMVKYAEGEDIRHILISGDLFDKSIISEKTVRYVEGIIVSHPGITFYYLKGNHDPEGFTDRIEMPENLRVFEENKWSMYTITTDEEKRICIYGTELLADTQMSLLTALNPREEDINIVMLHGQENDYVGKDKEIRIDLPRLKGKAIDYLALGHVHAPKRARLDGRGVYSYPGCPEGRGFDECGDRGFNVVTLDTKTGRVSVEFIPSASRRILEEKVEVTGISSTSEAIKIVSDHLEERLNQGLISASDIVKIVLTGDLEVEAEIDPDLIVKHLQGKLYYMKAVDCTGRIIDYNSFRNDKSLKGEFVRQVEKDATLTDSEKADIIRTGILLLSGRKEEV